MCGITGCLVLAENASPDDEWVGKATRRLAHRGGDDVGFYSDAQLALGCVRLASIDVSQAGQQPVRSADGRYVMVFDGVIYNYPELADRLRARGIRLRGRSDSEVLVETYALDGKNALRLLRGMYAFAIWDTKNRELLCCRDPFGIKPLYYAIGAEAAGRPGGTASQMTEPGGGHVHIQPSHEPAHGPGRQFKFASERKALAAPGEVTALDPNALRRYLSFQYVPPPATMTPPVRSLPPGHFLVARPGGPVDVFRYWRASLRPARSPSPETPERILAVLHESVAVHLRSDVPVGAFLTGGVDSAAITAIAARERPGLLTFTVGFERADYNEIDQATRTAVVLGVKSIPYLVTVAEFAACLPQIIWQLDDPMADASAAGLWFAAREARRHVKAVLSGEGADELFGGYPAYRQSGMVRVGKGLPAWGRNPLADMAARLPAGRKGKGLLERIATPLRERYIGPVSAFPADQVDALARYRGGFAADVTAPIYDQAEQSGLDDVATMQLVDIDTWLPGDVLVKADRAAAAHGLELRTPYLDRDVMAVAARLARAEKAAAGTTKFALREAVGSLLPQEAAERVRPAASVPVARWLRGELRGYAEQVLREARTGEWLNKRIVIDLFRRYQADDPDVDWRQIWVLLVFSLWHQIYVEHLYDPLALGWTPRLPHAQNAINGPQGNG